VSESRAILTDERIRTAMRIIYLVEVIVRLLLGLFYWLKYPNVATTTLLFVLPPLALFFLAKRLPILLVVLGLGIEAGFFLQMQVVDFGWESGFQIYLSCLALTTFLYEFLSLRMRIVFALAPFVGYALFIPTLPVLEPIYQLSRTEQFAFFSINLFVCTLINVGIVLFLVLILLRREKELKELAASRAQLVADMSHEIKTPVAAMLTRVQLALTETLPEPIHRLLVMLERNLRRQARLVNRMLDYSSAGQPFAATDVVKKVDLAALVRECVEAHQPFAEEKGLRWQIYGQAEPATDPDLLSHVLSNLIANAVAHSPQGGEIRITLDAEPDGPTSIFVQDQGPGIDPELLPRLFDPFVRGDAQRSRKNDRHGLGLSIAQRAVQQLGGEISVECPPEGGTRFLVTL